MVYFKIKINDRTANSAASVSSLTFGATAVGLLILILDKILSTWNKERKQFIKKLTNFFGRNGTRLALIMLKKHERNTIAICQRVTD
jgi:hypothetical protein